EGPSGSCEALRPASVPCHCAHLLADLCLTLIFVTPPKTAPTSGTCSLQCLNGGSCFLNARKQPKCRCQPRYTGEKCETDQCRDYCLNGGTCTASPTGNTSPRTPTCRCPNGFTGPNCNQKVCKGYCQNNASCMVNQGNQPSCQCLENFSGDKCQYRKSQRPRWGQTVARLVPFSCPLTCR
uniref:EGF-like domain-containing protein n=1 Tax=Erpetoichthys calabaricus TaxID=27687 RepID=A0A8C4X5R9_ERPCA